MSEPKDVLNRFPGRLKQARLARGLSLEAVSRMSGVSRSMLSQIERGQSSPTVATLLYLAQALQIEPADILAGSAPASLTVTRAAPGATDKRMATYPGPVSETQRAMVSVRLRKGESLTQQAFGPSGLREVWVLDGTLALITDRERHVLSVGDHISGRIGPQFELLAPDANAGAVLIWGSETLV